MTQDPHNTLFSLAADFVHYTNCSVFLTGKAGTGKTTFLKYIRKNTTKQTAVVAPTGVAAINAGGVTIHSFFQLPFTPFIPGAGNAAGSNTIDKHQLLSRIKLTKERRKVLQQLELLIIDEISMVRCDVLDAMDAVLRHFRARYYEPFGGVQVLFIGDMFQLPPVVTPGEWEILRAFYNSPYFFDSKAIQEQQPVHIELNKIYRQNEEQFIELLNKVRNNEMDEAGFSLLNSRLNASFKNTKEQGYIILTTHNYKADAVNNEELGRLKSSPRSFKAGVEGEFNDKAYPAEETLQLKEGAQVMFIKNDTEKVRRYFNGKIGVVTKIEEETIHVQSLNEPEAIKVKKEKWENIRYTLNQQSQKVEEEVIGSFNQFPLRLAWAITIHKSQGLTFEKAVIDAGTAFAPGQVYVALSRCTTLTGIILKNNITNAGLITDERIIRFAQQKHHSAKLTEALILAKKNYQCTVLTDLFDLNLIITQMKQLIKVVEEHKESFNEETRRWLEAMDARLEALQATAQKFQPQLQQLLNSDSLPEQNEVLQARVAAASNYYGFHLQALLEQLPRSPAVTDSKQQALAYNEEIKELHSLLSQRLQAFNSCRNGFTVDVYHAEKNKFVLSSLQVNAYASASPYKKTESPHPILHKQLRQLRDKICSEQDVPVYLVASSNSIEEMARYLPQTKDELKQISGFGRAKIEKLGARFLELIVNYCDQYQLTSCIDEKLPKRQRKEKKESNREATDTKKETYKLYKEGRSVSEIAMTRNLTLQTIEGHLAYFVQHGLISVDELVSKEKLVLIEPVAKAYDGGSLTSLKAQLGNNVSFGEIRLTLAWVEFQAKGG
jgi:uncharacterized protein YpbB